MKLFPILLAGLLPTLCLGQNSYPSLPSQIFSTYTPKPPATSSPESMAKAANTFLESLDEIAHREAFHTYDSPEKAIWTNVPPRGEQGGVRLGDLDEDQLKLALDLFAAVLSQQGLHKAQNIPLADDRLLNNGRRRPGFGAEDYWLAIFGKPSATEPWALQFDGHHLAINLAFHGNAMSLSPTFIGTQPRGFSLDGKTIEPMGKKDEAALALFRSLNPEQQKQATIGNTRVDLVAAAGMDGKTPAPIGLSAEGLQEDQRDKLMSIIALYVGDLPEPFAKRRLEELRGEIDQMKFAWWGPAEDKGDYSYRIQGPSLIIEYAGQDLGRDPYNHLHSMYRDPTNEYGARLKP